MAENDTPLEPDEIRVTEKVPSYAQTRFKGVCGSAITREDVEKKIYHPVFGGRGAYVALNGTWQAIRHDD